MVARKTRKRAGWWVAGLTLVCAAGGFLMLFRPMDSAGRKPAPGPRQGLGLVVVGEGTSSRLQLYDPTPLFLPTEWNASQQPLPAGVRPQPGKEVFGTFEPKFQFGEGGLRLPLPPNGEMPASPVALLREPSPDPFLGFDREDLRLPPLAARLGCLEVREMGTGRIVLAEDLPDEPASPAKHTDWQPAEFLIVVTATGMLGRPVEMGSSNVEEVDVFFRNYFAKTFHLGEKLPPGRYRVIVGP